MNGILVEIRNFGTFLEAVLIVAVITGAIFVPFIVLGYELSTKRRTR